MVLLGFGFLRWSMSRVQFDDAYISAVYARNLAEGHGLVFNHGERVEGFTNLLWVLILAAGAGFGIAPHLAAPALGVVAMMTLLGLAWWVVGRLPSVSDEGRLRGAAALAPLVLCHGFAATAGSGMETHGFALLVTASIVVVTVFRPIRLAGWLLSGVLPALVLLTRPDGVIPAGVAVLAAGLAAEGEGRSLLARSLRVAAAGAVPLLAGVAVLMFKWVYYGELLPNPYFAKGADGLQLEAGIAYLGGFVASYPFVPVCLALIGWAAWSRGTDAVGRLAVAAGTCFGLYWLLLVKVGGDFMEYRLAFHVLPVLVLAAAAAVAGIRPARRAWAIVVALAALSVTPAVPATGHTMQSLDEMDGFRRGGERVGRALARLPEDTRVATTLIGTIGYFGRRPLIDQWGLVDPAVRWRKATKEFNRGHHRFTHFPETIELGADLYFGHPEPGPCGRVRLDGPFTAALRTGPDECVWVAVTSRDPDFVALVCEREDLFPRVGEGICRDHPR
jgi:arabinofuranosyltransferase